MGCPEFVPSLVEIMWGIKWNLGGEDSTDRGRLDAIVARISRNGAGYGNKRCSELEVQC